MVGITPHDLQEFTVMSTDSSRSSRLPRRLAAATLAVASISLAACGSADGDADTAAAPYAEVRAASWTAGEPLPVPTGDVVLTISGMIDAPNAGDAVELDMAGIESLPVVEYAVDDQQAEGRVVTFQGVLLGDLLDAAGMSDDATMLETVALNDYVVEIPVEDVRDYPVLLATSVDGERIGVDQFGPTRVVYPYHAFDLDDTVYGPRWIWQLATIVVK